MPSEEIAAADATLAENAELRRALHVAMQENEQLHAVIRERAEKDAEDTHRLQRYCTDLSRQIGEQNTTIGYQDAMLARATADAIVLRQALTQAQADVCSLNCPSVWRTADGPLLHSVKCRALSAALTAEAPGAALLAELEAARAVVEAARVGVGGIERRRAVAAYDAAVKAKD